MSNIQFIVTILVLALATQITRFAPFLFFNKKDKLPSIIEYLGLVLPASMMGMLVIYCFKDYTFSNVLPALIAGLLTAIIHLIKRNTILSISLGTIVYMLIVNL